MKRLILVVLATAATVLAAAYQAECHGFSQCVLLVASGRAALAFIE